MSMDAVADSALARRGGRELGSLSVTCSVSDCFLMPFGSSMSSLSVLLLLLMKSTDEFTSVKQL